MHSTLTDFPICTADEREEIQLALTLLKRTVTDNPFIPETPLEPQAVFLTAPVGEILYGGAGGGGKSYALLMAALQYVDVPGYAAILFRRTYDDLSMPDGLIPISHKWLSGTKAHWNGQNHQWMFPSGASLTFRYLECERDKFKYKGPSFQFIGFDELTGFTETQYRFLFQRLRRPADMKIPLRMRGATNPGDIGHEWVKKRFIDGYHYDRLFVPATLEDNLYLDAESYDASLKQLDPVTRRQFRHGDWNIRPEGNLFKRAWFEGRIVSRPPSEIVHRVRAWDLAGTPEDGGSDPDWTAGVRMGETADNQIVIEDVRRMRGTPLAVRKFVASAGRDDGEEIPVRIEQEPGSSGKDQIYTYRHEVLRAHNVLGVRSTGDKITRAGAFSSACQSREVWMIEGPWVSDFIDELCAFGTPGIHDDQVDAASSAFNALRNELGDWTANDFSRVLQYQYDS